MPCVSLTVIGALCVSAPGIFAMCEHILYLYGAHSCQVKKLLHCMVGFTDYPFRNNCEKTVKHWVCFSNSIVQSLKHDVW